MRQPLGNDGKVPVRDLGHRGLHGCREGIGSSSITDIDHLAQQVAGILAGEQGVVRRDRLLAIFPMTAIASVLLIETASIRILGLACKRQYERDQGDVTG